jgi:hypothetical protein
MAEPTKESLPVIVLLLTLSVVVTFSLAEPLKIAPPEPLAPSAVRSLPSATSASVARTR